MEVSILSKGESLASTWPHVGVGAVTIAINQAIVAAPAVDWLCMLDAHKLMEPVPDYIRPMVGIKPRVGVFTSEAYMPIASAAYPGLRIIGSDHIQRVGYDRMTFTALAALWFATQDLGATVLHLHGYDLGGANVLGARETDERGARRWPAEARILTSVCHALRARGCVIHSYGAYKV